MQVVRFNVVTYLRDTAGSSYAYYDYPGAVSTVAIDMGAQCRFYVQPQDIQNGALLHGEMFVFVDKKTLLPVGKANIVW